MMKRTTPRFQADFITGTLDPRVSFSRANNNATRVNASGAFEIVNANLPRFDYDRVTLQPRGLLVEESKQNFAMNSGWLNAVSGTPGTAPTNWGFFASSGSTLVTSDDLGGRKIQFTANPSSIYIIFYYVIAAFSTTTFSVYIDAMTGSFPLYQIMGTQSVPGGTTFNYFVNGIPRGDSFAPSAGDRISLRIIAGATAGPVFAIRMGIGASTGPVTGQAVTLSKPQIESGDITSYIPTAVGSTAIRGADIATITGANFDSFWRAGRGSALVRARLSTVSGIRPLLQFDDTTAGNIIALRGNTTNPELYIRSGGSDQAQIDAGTIAINTSYRLAGAWAADNCAAILDSGMVVTDVTAAIPAATQARLGSDGTNYLNGHIEAVEYYDERAVNASLQVVSSTAGYRSIIGSVFRDAIIS